MHNDVYWILKFGICIFWIPSVVVRSFEHSKHKLIVYPATTWVDNKETSKLPTDEIDTSVPI